MASRKATMSGMMVGSTIGSWLPSLWGADWLSITSILLSVVGGLAGIWVAFKLTE